MSGLKPGDKVRWNDKENGIIKAVDETGYYVVFQCSGNWERYEDYTPAFCKLETIKPGWK